MPALRPSILRPGRQLEGACALQRAAVQQRTSSAHRSGRAPTGRSSSASSSARAASPRSTTRSPSRAARYGAASFPLTPCDAHRRRHRRHVHRLHRRRLRRPGHAPTRHPARRRSSGAASWTCSGSPPTRAAGRSPSSSPASSRFSHGMTVATNAVLTRSGVPVALLTTRGAGDTYEIGRALPRLGGRCRGRTASADARAAR